MLSMFARAAGYVLHCTRPLAVCFAEGLVQALATRCSGVSECSKTLTSQMGSAAALQRLLLLSVLWSVLLGIEEAAARVHKFVSSQAVPDSAAAQLQVPKVPC